MASEQIQELHQEQTSDGGDKSQVVVAQVQQKTEAVKKQVGGRLREQLGGQSGRLAEQLGPFPEALRQAGAYLESHDNARGAQAADRMAGQAERLSSYLQEADGERIVGDVEDFARRRPWTVGAAAAAAGFIASRFLKASAERRYDSRHGAS